MYYSPNLSLVSQLIYFSIEQTGTCSGPPDPPDDDTLEFTDNTPDADGTTVRIALTKGADFVSLECSVTSGSNTFTGDCKPIIYTIRILVY